MAKAKKLPSGNWRVRVYSFTDASGSKHQESFTAPTKAEAEMLAAEYLAHKHRKHNTDLTVKEALTGYIKAKSAVLSPSTIREYNRMLNYDFDDIGLLKIKKLTSEDLQLFVSRLAERLSPKTVRNRYALLTASIGLYAPDMTFRVTLPAKQVNRPTSPTDDDVRAILTRSSGDLKICVALAICGLRRGEIAALKYEDIIDGVAHVHADMVQNQDNEWIYKEIPKTDGSDRFVKLPDFVMDLIGTGSGFIVSLNPNSITQAFGRLNKQLGFNYHLHQMRHYYASIGAVLQIPDVYLADFGGWRHDSKVMKTAYQNKIAPMSDYYADKMNKHLDKIAKEDA